MFLEPLHDNVVIEPNAEEKVTAGGILVPDTATAKVTRGKVLAVGPGVWREGATVRVSLSVGEEVLYGKYSGTEVEIDGKKLLVTPERDILCKVQK